MQVTLETKDALERALKVEVPEDRIVGEVENRLQSLARTTKIQGFRPGKVPYKVVKQRYGDQVRQEVLGKLLQSSLSEAIIQENLRPAGSPEIRELETEKGAGLTYTATFEVLPEIELQPVEKLEIEQAYCEINEEDIDRMIEVLRKQRTDLKSVEREATDKDVMEIDFQGYVDGNTFEGGDASNFRLDLGEKRLLDGFENGLIGRKAGEELSLNLEFPADYHVSELAGKPVEFKVTVRQVSEKVLPELDDEFFKAFGIAEGGMEAFRKQVREHMEKEVAEVLKRRLRDSVMKSLHDANKVELPKVMINEEVQRIKKQFENNLKAQGLEPENIKHSEDDEIFQEQAQNRVSLQLLVGEIIRKNEINADPAKVRETVMKYAENYQDPSAIVNWYYSDKNRLAEIEAMTLENEVVNWITERATLTRVQLTFDECMNKRQTDST